MGKKALGLLAVFAAGLVLALGGCGGDGNDNNPAGTNGTTTSDGYSRY
jgi:hypothetical protein